MKILIAPYEDHLRLVLVIAPIYQYSTSLWFQPLWKMMEFVSWDDDIPNWMESHKIHVPNHQPDIINHY